MSASVTGNVELVNLLLRYGATVNDVDADSHTALWLASGQGNKMIVEVFHDLVCLCKHTHMHVLLQRQGHMLRVKCCKLMSCSDWRLEACICCLHHND